jgi:ABC-type transporter Mla MlaB component
MTAGDEGVDTITLSGPVTLLEAGGVRERLRSAFGEGRPLRIDLGSAGPWDLAGLQLLVSAVASGRASGRSVTLLHVPEGCRETAERAGLSGWLASVSGPP